MSLPDALAAAAGAPGFPVLALACLVAGGVRGFSGFGTALVFMPVASSVASPAVALAALMIFDNAGGLSLLPWGLRRCRPREVAPLFAGVVVGVPLGVWALASLDAEVLRWLVCGLAAAAWAALVSGLRWRGPAPGWKLAAPVGLLSGTMGGVSGLAGVPVVLMHLGVGAPPETMRANIIVLFMAASILSVAMLAWQGLFTLQAVALGLILTPIFLLGIVAGRRLYPYATEAQFRRLAQVLILAAILAGFPLWS